MKISNSVFNLFSRFKYFLPSFSQGSGIFFQVTSKIRHCFPRYFQNQTFSSKLLPRSGVFFHVTSKIRYFLARFCKTRHFLQDLERPTLSCKIFQDTCKNNALFSNILEVKSDRFLQKMYGGSTRVNRI